MTRRHDIPTSAALLLAILLLLGAWFVRIYRLDSTVPGLQTDAADNLADALRISRGGLPFPLAFDTRPEPAYRFLLAGWYVVAGPSLFSSRLFQVFLGLIAVALAYRAALELLRDLPWRRLGALAALGALAGMTPHLFLSRVDLRAILLPPVVLLAVITLLRAARTRRSLDHATGGFFAALGLHTYIAGLVAPLWLAVYLVHQLIVAPKGERLTLREAGITLLGAIPPLAAWLALLLAVPNLYDRIRGASDTLASQSTSAAAILAPLAAGRLLPGLWASARAFFLDGYWQTYMNAPNTPFLNPPLAVLAAIGLGAALWRWRRGGSILVIGGLLLFMLPAALSEDAASPVRLSGTMGLVALLVGLGVAALAALIAGRLRAGQPSRFAVGLAGAALIAGLSGFALIGAGRAYQRLYADPAQYAEPDDWKKVPWQNSLIYVEYLDLLAKADQPTYVPLSSLDTSVAMYWLQRAAYPNVTTWARAGLETLPAGQAVYPTHYSWGAPAPPQDALQALLLPASGTIVILPPQPGRRAVDPRRRAGPPHRRDQPLRLAHRDDYPPPAAAVERPGRVMARRRAGAWRWAVAGRRERCAGHRAR